ncbi:MAG: NAD(+)/NADH kinase [Blautia sp.]|jgi:NAD+ kinase
MDRFCIITNTQKDENLETTHKIECYLKKNHRSCHILVAGTKTEGQTYHYTNPDYIPDDVECIIVLGGDGTLLQAARDVVHKKIPLFGINLGTLGYLAEIDKASIYPALDQLMQGDYEIEERMMLKGRVYHKDQEVGGDIALNDIVISRSGPLRVIRFINYVNREYLNVYSADGIIISTPTGSTGYSLSAGGPIVSPSAQLSLMTPLAAHTLNARSIILPAEDEITVEIGQGRRQLEETAVASFDGDTTIPMKTGDKIIIERAKVSTKIIKLSNLSFVEVLRQKMRDS